MENIDILIEARWVIPVEPDGTVLEQHAVAIANGRIVAVLPAAAEKPRIWLSPSSSEKPGTFCAMSSALRGAYLAK